MPLIERETEELVEMGWLTSEDAQIMADYLKEHAAIDVRPEIFIKFFDHKIFSGAPINVWKSVGKKADSCLVFVQREYWEKFKKFINTPQSNERSITTNP